MFWGNLLPPSSELKSKPRKKAAAAGSKLTLLWRHRMKQSIIYYCVNGFFSIDLILLATLGPGAFSVSNRNAYQKQKNNVSRE
jgi:hypothetical protein